jgi:sugar lactone lactonase YvrE
VSTRSAFFIWSFVLSTLLFACSGNNNKNKVAHRKDFILEEKDLLPEGVAFDPVTGSIYVSSTYKRKIVRIDAGGDVKDFVIEKQDGIWSTIGMEADAMRRHLWVVSSQAKEVLPLLDPDSLQWRSAIYQYNLGSATLIDSCLLPLKNAFLNDLTVAPNGDLYITESMQGGIYYLKAGADSLELFLTPAPYTFPNGICFPDQPGHLFVSTAEGILKIDIMNRRYDLLKTGDSINAKDIDGLSYHRGGLIGHQSTKVVRFVLNDSQDSIIYSTVLATGPEFDSSTTGEMGNDQYYFIVNSQIRSGIDFKKQVIKPLDSLEKIIIRKIQL